MGVEQWHGITIETNLSTEEIVKREQKALTQFFGYEIGVPPPAELLQTMQRAEEIGWIQAEGHYIPNITMQQNSNFPGWKIKPEEWFWGRFEEKGLKEGVKTLEGNWIIIDGSQKPEYQDGAQMYANDPFTSILSSLRESGKIEKPEWTWRVASSGSRFGISYDEIQTRVNPTIAALLGVTPAQVRLPRAMEYNLLGNLYHPEWGETSTWEFLQEIYEDAGPLLVAKKKNGGLAAYDCTSNMHHEDNLGFRPLVIFPKVVH